MEGTVRPSEMPKSRIRGIDICRSVAILLAMWSHVFVTFGARWEGLSYSWVRFSMQMAPIVFICLFGSMLEIAYSKKFEQGRIREAVLRLMQRAGQCYVLYVLSVLALYVADRYSLGYAIRTMLLAGVTPFTDILKFYAIALFLAPALIWFRRRAGLGALLGCAMLVHLAHPLLAMISVTARPGSKHYLGPILGFLYGGSDAGVGAPSLLHGLSIVCVGIALGAAIDMLFSEDGAKRRRGAVIFAGVFGCSLAASLLMWTDTMDVLRGIVSLRIRNANEPFYYALGLAATISFLAACLLTFDRWQFRFLDWLRFIGTTSLFTFCFGNVLLYTTPMSLHPHEPWVPAVAYMVLIPVQSWVFWWLTSTAHGKASILGLIVARTMERANELIGLLAKPFADRYARLLPQEVDRITTQNMHSVAN